MKTITRLEDFALLLLSISLYSTLDYPWWLYPLLFFLPDLSLLGLLVGKKRGALAYNFVHHRLTAVLIYLAGGLLRLPLLSLAGSILLGHSSFDRALGFPLLEPDSATPDSLKPSVHPAS